MKRADIEKLLPSVYRTSLRGGDALTGAFLDVMEDLHRQAEAALRDLDHYFDPLRAPEGFVPFLGQWVDLDRFYEKSFCATAREEDLRDPIASGMGRLRAIIRHAASLSAWRGTKRGLLDFLRIATGSAQFSISEIGANAGAELPSFHFIVRAPESMRALDDLIREIIRSEKPAYATYEIEYFAQQPADPP